MSAFEGKARTSERKKKKTQRYFDASFLAESWKR
jgi:hypothetical protein